MNVDEAPDNRPEGGIGDVAGAQVLVRSLRLLFHLREAATPVRASELVDVLETPKSNVYRLIQTLELAGLVARTPSGGVELGLRFLDLAQASNARVEHHIAPAALPVMRALSERVRETSLFTMPTGTHAICVLTVDSPHPVRLSYSTGRVLPMHGGASGKVLLPWLPARLLDAALRDAGPRSAQLEREVAEIREKGHCITRGELDPGLTGVAAPVLLDGRHLLGGLTIAGPTERFAESRLPELIARVREAASRIARRHRQTANP